MTEPRMVRLRAYGDEIIERVLLGYERGRPIITSREEYEAAQRTGRAPAMLLWPASDDLGPVEPAPKGLSR